MARSVPRREFQNHRAIAKHIMIAIDELGPRMGQGSKVCRGLWSGVSPKRSLLKILTPLH